jgi:hypothetical protein
MRDPNDNLDSVYQAFKDQSEDLRQLFEDFNAWTEKTYQAFKEIMEEHPDIGRAAMVIMARNQASHIISIVRNGKTRGEVFRNVTAMISPMFQMMYDRLVSETIESEMSGSGEEGEET